MKTLKHTALIAMALTAQSAFGFGGNFECVGKTEDIKVLAKETLKPAVGGLYYSIDVTEGEQQKTYSAMDYKGVPIEPNVVLETIFFDSKNHSTTPDSEVDSLIIKEKTVSFKNCAPHSRRICHEDELLTFLTYEGKLSLNGKITELICNKIQHTIGVDK